MIHYSTFFEQSFHHNFEEGKTKIGGFSVYKHNSKVLVEKYEGLTVDFCKDQNVKHIIRGLRNPADFEFEKKIALFNNSLEDIETMIRGTIRKVGFPKSWNMLVRLGLTDDSFKILNCNEMTYRDFLNCFLPYDKSLTIEEKVKRLLTIEEKDFEMAKLSEINLFSDSKKIPFKNASPAHILEHILKEAWQLQANDKDMIVMYHEFKYLNKLKKEKKIISTMGCIGENSKYTAMAKTVGLPLGISCLMILNKKISSLGVQTPVNKEIYTPVLEELKSFGISFNEIYL